MVNAVILAGAPNTGPLRQCSDVSNEALIEISGRPMVQYVIDGLRASGRVNRIAVVAPPGEIEPFVHGENLQFIPAVGDIMENLRAAVQILPQDQHFLIATSDIPLLNGEVVRGFLELCSGQNADLFYPIVEKGINDRRYPGVKRTYIHFREGSFTGGNVFLVNPRVVEPCAPKVKRFLDYRKHPVRLASLLGWSFVFRLFLRQLSLREVESVISRLWGIRGSVVMCPYPEVGIDVDKPSDLDLARIALTP